MTAPVPDIAEFDRGKARKIAKGQVAIDARIDLHGDRQSDAHRRLRGFLLDAYARGRRTVLVITGKGRERDGGFAPADLAETRESGVLRRNVPRWLEEPQLRDIVVSYTSAHPRHGGAGALYVHIRRKRAGGR